MVVDRSRRSPNYGSREGRPIKSIILHATVGSAQSALAWLTNPAAKVSAHYLITKAGTIYQLVDDEHAAWHAGRASWQGETAMNETSLGIEIENANTGRDPYPEVQIQAVVELVSAKIRQYRLGPGMVARHVDIALPRGRKSDPAGFPWSALLQQVFPANDVVPVRPLRPSPLPEQPADLAGALLAEAYHQVGATGQQYWAFGREAARTGLGLPVGGAFDVQVGSRLYSAQAFAKDTLIAPLGEWRTLIRLSSLTNSADQPLRDAVLGMCYARIGATYRSDWALHQEAQRVLVGPPVSPISRIKVAGQEYVVGCYALDVLYSPVGRWQTIGRLSRLPEQGANLPLRQALYQCWCDRIGVPLRPEWILYKEAVRNALGAPLGPSFRVRSAGQDFVAEAFALDVLACEIGEWGTVMRLSALPAVVKGGRAHAVSGA